MKHVSLDEQSEEVTKFVLSLIANPNGSLLELNGKAVACVAAPKLENGDSTPEGWTAVKHARRAELIKQKYSGGLTPVEVAELATLQELLVKYRQQVAPVSLERVRRVRQRLLSRASAIKFIK